MRLAIGLLILAGWSEASPAGTAASLEREAQLGDRAYLAWSETQCAKIGEAMRANGRVGGFFDTRIVGTNKSYNYKLRATWLTPEVIRAAARLEQLELGLTDEETVALVTRAESAGDTVILVEIDPREGSGIIPRDWVARLGPKTSDDSFVGSRGPVQPAGTDDSFVGSRGLNRPELRSAEALSGTGERDYAYDLFWLAFSLLDDEGQPLLSPETREAELAVRIQGKEGRVSWAIPSSIRKRTSEIAAGGEAR